MRRIIKGLVCTAAMLAAITQIGCGLEETESEPTLARRASELGAPFSFPSLNTLINDSIQIDQLGTGLAPQDANLFVGLDPADKTDSINKPTPGPGNFIDWEDLRNNLDNHRILDLNLPTGLDPTSFPSSNECVGSSTVLKKMDITYVAVANNKVWAYLAVQRSANTGDAGYYWLFTKLRPQTRHEELPCVPGQTRLLYDISVGDVLLGGHFHPNGTPLLRVFKAVKSQAAVPAPEAINFDSSLWKEDPSSVAAAAVNTTITAPGSFGSQGVESKKGSNLSPELFAEVAVPVSVFLGDTNQFCGKAMYGSVITRSSGSGGTSPDLKDLAGPAIFNFISGASADVEIRPTCSLDVEFEAKNAFTSEGFPIENPICEWTFDDGTTATGCNGSVAVRAGTRTATVKVTNPGTECSGTITTAPITVYSPLSVTPDLVGSCDASFNYSAEASGGSGSAYSYSWSFTGGSVTPASSSERTGTVTVGAGSATYSGTVTVTDVRPDGLTCTASGSDSTGAFRTTAIAEIRPTCSQNVEFALTSASGLDGAPVANPTCTWTFDDGTTATGCAGVQALAAGQHSATVTVTDPSNNCSDTFITQPVTVYQPVSATADLVGSCDASFAYAAQGSGGSGAYSYAWSFTGGGSVTPSSSSTATGSVAVGPGTTTYSGTVIITDARPDGLSCTATASDQAGVFRTTAAAEIRPTCSQNVEFALTGASGLDGEPVANPTCTWTFDDGSTATGCQGAQSLPAGSHTATVKVTDPSNSCSQTITTLPVTVYQPVSVAANLVPTCESFTYSAEGSGGSGAFSYSWSFAGGGSVTPSNSSTATGSVAVSGGSAAYSGTVTLTDARPDGLTCTASASAETGVFETTATAAIQPTCTLDVQFGLTSASGSDGKPVANPTCTWTFDDGSTATGCQGTQSLPAGAHSATVTVTDPSNNCSDTIATQAITVYQPLSLAADLKPTCESFTYSAEGSGGSGAFSYSWSFSGGGSVTPSSSSTAAGSVAVGAGSAEYSGTVTLTDTRPDGLSCTASVSAETGVFETTATAKLEPTCDLDVELKLTSASGSDGAPVANPSCTWTFDDGTTATGCTGDHPLAAGSHSASLTVTDPSNNCSDTIITAPITVYPPLAVTADLAGTCDASFTYSAQGSGGTGAFSYLWSFAGGGSVTPSSSSTAAGSVAVGAGATGYSGTVTLTNVRPDGLTCTTTASDETKAFRTTATAAIHPTCTLDVNFGLTGAFGLDGTQVANPICTWTFNDGTTATGCAGVQSLPAGLNTATVTVTDPSNDCSDTIITEPITVYEPLSVTADLTGTCDASFNYSAQGSGGFGAFSYLWSFAGGGSLTPSSSSNAAGSVAVGPGPTGYSGMVTLTDVRPDGLTCTTSASDGTNAFKTTATAALQPTCTLDVNFGAGASGVDGAPVANPTCTWTFDDGSTATGCDGVQTLAAGLHTATVTITDPSNNCTGTSITQPVTVYEPVAVTADLVGTCEGSFTYSAVGSGGSGGFSYLWSFAGGGAVTPSSSTTAAGSVAVAAGATAYSGTVTLSDARPDGLNCPATASDETTAFMPIQVNLARANTSQVCPSMTDDGLRYDAVVSGGSGNYSYVWNGVACSGNSCVINPSDGTFCDTQTFSLTISDDSGLCAAATSETEAYSKITVVSSSDN